MTESYTVWDNIVGKRDMTPEEKAQRQKDVKDWNDASATRKLDNIKSIRLKKLIETDHFALSDNILSDDMKNFRKKMRDIPQDFDSSKYDELLARETDKTKANFGELTHSVWSKP